MEGNARAQLAAILVLFACLSPLASASFFDHMRKYFGPPTGPDVEPWLKDPDIGDSLKGKHPPKRTPKKLATHLVGDLHLPAYGLRTAKNAGVQISLRAGFYEKTCPRAEQIVNDVVTKAVQNRSEVAAWLLSLHFHDCFVKGCDASLLLDKTPSGEKTEKQALPNLALQGYEVIDTVKSKLEKECPGIVSCADTLAFAARDSLVLSGVPSYKVPSGRRDARVSREADVLDNIPEANDPLDKILLVFERKGLTLEDLVVLEGVNSFGVAHSLNFAYGLGELNGKKELDLKMNSDFHKKLLGKNVQLQADVTMVNDSQTSSLMKELAADQGLGFEKLVTSMIRMGNLEVLTGTQGEIRKKCTEVN